MLSGCKRISPDDQVAEHNASKVWLWRDQTCLIDPDYYFINFDNTLHFNKLLHLQFGVRYSGYQNQNTDQIFGYYANVRYITFSRISSVIGIQNKFYNSVNSTWQENGKLAFLKVEVSL